LLKHITDCFSYALQNNTGCCWWGRGVLRQLAHGRCFFGQLNYYLGRRAAADGNPALYPKVDFCEFPEAICSSEHSNELRWVSGMFFWVKRLQSFNKNGWNYMNKIRKLSSGVLSGGEADKELMMEIDCVLRTGKIKCGNEAVDMSERLNDVLEQISTFNLPTQAPTSSHSPSASPTELPTGMFIFTLSSLCQHETQQEQIPHCLLSSGYFLHLQYLPRNTPRLRRPPLSRPPPRPTYSGGQPVRMWIMYYRPCRRIRR